MKKIVFILLLTATFSGCSPEKELQKKWISENLSTLVWNDVTYEALNNEYQELSSLLIDYSNQCMNTYFDKSVDTYYGNNFRSELLRTFDEIDTIFGGESFNTKRDKTINRYKSSCESRIENLRENLGVCLRLRDSLLVATEWHPDDDVFCSMLLGEPEDIPRLSSEEEFEIARNLTINLFYEMSKPTISAIEYISEYEVWLVRMDNADNQYVKFYLRDDESYDVEYGCELDITGSPDTDESFTITLQ